VLGGQRIAVTKPRARHLERGELELPTFAWAADSDPLDMAMLASIAAGVSTLLRVKRASDPFKFSIGLVVRNVR
jgi:hypothetical protein